MIRIEEDKKVRSYLNFFLMSDSKQDSTIFYSGVASGKTK
jgi:hypothetical protein